MSIRSWSVHSRAIQSEARPDSRKGRLAYLRNIVRETGRFGGEGWQTYDYAFRSQAAANPAMDWSELNPSLLLSFMPTSLLHGNQPSVYDGPRIARLLGRGALLAKLDLKNAYRNVPIHPDDCMLLGVQWKEQVYVDSALPFGLRSAPKIFTALADGLSWAFQKEGIVHTI